MGRDPRGLRKAIQNLPSWRAECTVIISIRKSIVHPWCQLIVRSVNTSLNVGISQFVTASLSVILVHCSDGLAQVACGDERLDVTVTKEEVAASVAMDADGETTRTICCMSGRRQAKINLGILSFIGFTIGVTAKENAARSFHLGEAHGDVFAAVASCGFGDSGPTIVYPAADSIVANSNDVGNNFIMFILYIRYISTYHLLCASRKRDISILRN